MGEGTDAALTSETVLAATDDQLSSDLADERVILQTDRGTYYGVNAVGARVWELLQESTRFGELCETIAAEFEVDVDDCEADLRPFLEDLRDADLVEVRERTAGQQEDGHEQGREDGSAEW